MKRLRVIFLLLCSAFIVKADYYWIAFTDKNNTPYSISNPQDFMSKEALDRRQKFAIPIDSLDIPVNESYIDKLKDYGCSIRFASKWLNGVTVEINDKSIVDKISELDFVKEIELTYSLSDSYSFINRKKSIEKIADINYGMAQTQIEQLSLNKLHELGYKGSGIKISIVDDGFYRVNSLDIFNETRNQIIDTYDIYDPESDIYSGDDHGTMVFSTIAGVSSDYQGAATEADYYLIRTENDDYESIYETDALVRACELSDSLGVDIITSSLGYLDLFDSPYTKIKYSQLDGKTFRASRAATIAARKGMLLCIAIGNEGYDPWHYLDFPADADSILSVGSVAADSTVSPFSSYGPSADGRIKPEICAMGSGTALVNTKTGNVRTSSGTSFSTPLIAGMAASLWSALPELNNMQIRERIIRSATHYNKPDNHIGYGIPNAWLAYKNEQQVSTSISAPKNYTTQNNGAVYDLLGRRMSASSNLPNGIYITEKEGIKTVIIK